MTLVLDKFRSLLPRTKSSPSGWISFNAVCCHHNGDHQDTRKRGGVLFSNEGFQYHCFNCGAKAFYAPGFDASNTLLDLMRDLHADNEDILNLILEIKKLKSTAPQEIKKECIEVFDFDHKLLYNIH